MTTLVCFDSKAGTLRRYKRGYNKDVICKGEAVVTPWSELPQHMRLIDRAELESFRELPEPTAPMVA